MRPRPLLIALFAAALTLTPGCAATTAQNSSANANPPLVDTATWQTRWGPLSADDRDLIKKVRLASLWEMPAAEQASQIAQSAKVRQVSAQIAAQHMTLDVAVRDIAAKLNVELPVQPNTAQKGWLADIAAAPRGRDYDETYVKWLRFAHGQIYALIGTVRGTTRNSLVRAFADTANTFVLNHMRLLESTGLVGAPAFPSPPPVTLHP